MPACRTSPQASRGRLMRRALLVALLCACPIASYAQTPNVVMDGNSLCSEMYGVRAVTVYLPLASATAVTITNVCVPGASTPQLAANAPTRVDTKLQSSAINVLVFWEGTNDLYYGATPEVAYANLKTYLLARRAAGWKVAVLTLLPRWSAGVPSDFEASRQYVNYMLRRYWLDYADALIDVGADSIMGQPDTIWNAQWYQAYDNTHLAEAGSHRIGRIVAEQIQALLR